MFEQITIEQVLAFVVFVSALYGGVKYLKKELKEAITEMLKGQFDSIDKKLENDDKRIKDYEQQQTFILKAISLLLQDDLAILEHLRTNNASGEMAKQEKKVHDFLTETKTEVKS